MLLAGKAAGLYIRVIASRKKDKSYGDHELNYAKEEQSYIKLLQNYVKKEQSYLKKVEN
jgi:hypothetical protein